MLYYFYATEHPAYLAAMKQLKADLNGLGLAYIYDTYKHLTRFENLLLRPARLLTVLQEHECPIVSLDADCRVLDVPVFKTCDLACRMYNGRIPILGTLYLEPTKVVFKFLHNWYHAMLEDQRDQQISFRRVFKESKLRTRALPDEYAVLKEEGEVFDHPIIIHDYISRSVYANSKSVKHRVGGGTGT